MKLSNVIESLPNGFHDSKLLSLNIDWLESILVLKLSVWMDEGPNNKGSFTDARKIGKLQLNGLQSIFMPQDGFDRFIQGDGAWIDIGFEFSKIQVPTEFTVNPNSGWIYFNDFDCFIFFTAADAEFTWVI